MSRLWSPLTIASVLTALFVLGAVACAGEGDLGTYDDGENAQNNQNDENDEPDNQKPDNQDEEPPAELTELQQWCAAAGESDDGELTSLHCTGPHDVSGFEASDGDHSWQPGGFHVVVE